MQLADWRAALNAGAVRVGWKLGMGERERIDGPVIGHLTSATALADGATYHAGRPLHADAELAVELNHDLSVSGFAPALELADLSSAPYDDAETIVARNVFHRAVAFGPWSAEAPGVFEARLIVDGEVRASAPAANDVGDKVVLVARLLTAVGERLESGDRIITGGIVQVPVAPDEHVVAELGALGRVALSVS